MKRKEIEKPMNAQRRKFVFGFSILAAFAAFSSALGLPFFNKKELGEVRPDKKRTVKMLTQDGKLVEVDASLISSKRKISNTELQNWIKK